MIVVETLLKDIFSQIPPVVDSNGKEFPVKFHWGGQEDLNLYMKQESGNKTPLIWLIQSPENWERGEVKKRAKFILAKNAPNPTDRNPVVWEKEFDTYLNPLLKKVQYGFSASGIMQIIQGSETVYRESNYSYERGENGEVTNTTDFWNVITYEVELFFYGNGYDCVRQINYNLI